MSWGEHDLHRMLRELRALRSFRDSMDSGNINLSVSLRYDGADINIAVDKATTLKLLDDREREILQTMKSRRGEIERLTGELRELESIAFKVSGDT